MRAQAAAWVALAARTLAIGTLAARTLAIGALAIGALAGSMPSAVMAQSLDAVQAGHIAANVPPEAAFAALLRRDVRAWLDAEGLGRPDLVLELLRRGATQSGVSLPKFYLWLTASGPGLATVEGAMRVAAIDGARFEVTDFVSAAAIRADASGLGAVFPAALVPAIAARAEP